MENFDHVWKWKLQTDTDVTNVLDEDNIRETYKRLSNILPKWQTYRNGKNSSPLKTLSESLKNISLPYNEIRRYSLLEFEEIPEAPLRKIWHELGRVKEYKGQMNEEGYYYAIAVCKPLLLIWGQTLAFDSKVRKNMPRKYGIPSYRFKLSYDEWRNAMCAISEDLNDNAACIEMIKEISSSRYKVTEPVPYGRYLDIYYWTGK